MFTGNEQNKHNEQMTEENVEYEKDNQEYQGAKGEENQKERDGKNFYRDYNNNIFPQGSTKAQSSLLSLHDEEQKAEEKKEKKAIKLIKHEPEEKSEEKPEEKSEPEDMNAYLEQLNHKESIQKEVEKVQEMIQESNENMNIENRDVNNNNPHPETENIEQMPQIPQNYTLDENLINQMDNQQSANDDDRLQENVPFPESNHVRSYIPHGLGLIEPETQNGDESPMIIEEDGFNNGIINNDNNYEEIYFFYGNNLNINEVNEGNNG